MLLVHQELKEALVGDSKLPVTLSIKEKKDLLKKEHSTLIISLGDETLREVAEGRTTVGIWLKLESLYITKSLINKLYTKKGLHQLKTEDGMSIKENISLFTKAILDLKSIEVKIDEEDQTVIIMLTSPIL